MKIGRRTEIRAITFFSFVSYIVRKLDHYGARFHWPSDQQFGIIRADFRFQFGSRPRCACEFRTITLAIPSRALAFLNKG